MDWITALKLLGGLALLIAGGEWLVRSASRLATSFGISSLIVGLTVVAMGTSTPELVVSTVSAWDGKRDIAVGNIVGGNIFSVFGVLGAAAAIAPNGVAVAPAALELDTVLDGRHPCRVPPGVLERADERARRLGG
jgi:cation:H+ antiporter